VKCCCFTGNRPARFPWGSDESAPECERLKAHISAEVERLVCDGYGHFITGMAQGADTFCAEAVLSAKSRYPHITLECAVPCPEQTRGWDVNAVNRYKRILDKADAVVTLSPHYTRGCMMKRNAYMVSRADFVLAVWDGEKRGGTFNTLEKARRDNKDMRIVSF